MAIIIIIITNAITRTRTRTRKIAVSSSKKKKITTTTTTPNPKAAKEKEKAKSTQTKPIKNPRNIPSYSIELYCLTSAAGSYTDFHIDFGGSDRIGSDRIGSDHPCRVESRSERQSQNVFIVTITIPPTRQNLRVYETKNGCVVSCRSDQAEFFLPDLMKE